MAGVSLLSLVRRLKTVTSTRKITSAMGLVATSKYQKVKRLLSSNEVHFSSLIEIIRDVSSEVAESDSIFVAHEKDKTTPEVNKKLIIIFNSTKGMVGGYNSEVMEKALSMIETEIHVPYIFTTGTRGMAFINKFIAKEGSKTINVSDVPCFKSTSELLEEALELYKKGYVNEVQLIYTRYLSPVRTEVVAERLLPIAVENFSQIPSIKVETENTVNTEGGPGFEFQPPADKMQDRIFGLYLKEKLYNTALHAKTSEQSVRMRAMDSATKNADEILRDLTKQFNRLRQSTITQEITEIVGGAEALK
ncbi:MAG: ATP synthase F1 subunit gamma [Clostridiaceae bacterium]